MNPYNPYEAPQVNEPTFGAAADGSAQAAIHESMKTTRPWVLFLSILGFLGAGSCILIGLLVVAAGSAMMAFAKGGMDKFTPLFGLVYLLFGAFQLVPSVLLWRYGTSIGDYARANSIDTLATAVQRQASFWRFTGIATAVFIGLYFVGIFIAVAVGVMAGLKH